MISASAPIPSVGIFIDGVYSARSGEALIFFDDIERVEVLKGPQGTLFGRNTAAGAISIVTNKPTDQFEGLVDFKTGNYNKEEGTIVLNVPITDTLALRVDGIVNRRDGYTFNSFNGQYLNDEDNESTRVALRWHPDSNTDLILAWDHDNTDVTPPTALGINPFSHNGGNPFGATYDDEIDGRETRILDNVTLTGTEKFDDLLLTSISAYKFFKTTNLESETGSPDLDRYFDTENLENNHSFYQELRLNGTSGPFTFAAGGSYFYERAKQESKASATIDSIDSTLTAAGVGPLFGELIGSPQLQSLLWNEQMDNIGKNRSWSLFGDATYAVTDQLNLTRRPALYRRRQTVQLVCPAGVGRRRRQGAHAEPARDLRFPAERHRQHHLHPGQSGGRARGGMDQSQPALRGRLPLDAGCHDLCLGLLWLQGRRLRQCQHQFPVPAGEGRELRDRHQIAVVQPQSRGQPVGLLL